MPRRWLVAACAILGGCAPQGGRPPHAREEPAAPAAVRPFRIAAPDLVLLVTGGTNGLLEVCNCAGPMPGGLARRSGLVRSYRAAFPRTFLLDTGDVFWIDPEDLRNEFVLRGYGQIGYDAVVLGDQEWAAGPAHLAGILQATGAAFLTGPVAAEGLAARPAVTRDLGPVKLAVLADVPPSAFRFVDPRRAAGLTFAGRAELARRAAELRGDGYTVVLVAHMDEESLKDAAAAIPADLILRGHTSRSEAAVQHIAGRPVLKVGGNETVGAVALKVKAGRITDLDYRVEPVDLTWPPDNRLIQTYQAYAHAAMRQALDAKRKAGLDYLASEACGHCHQPQLAAWRKTRHAGAYLTLQRAGRTDDPSCLMCHTSGFGTESGFRTFEKTPRLANVNCQDCHRFNDLEHRQLGYLFEPVSRDVCTSCHTPVTDPKFDFAAKAPTVRCPRSPKPPRDMQPFRAGP